MVNLYEKQNQRFPFASTTAYISNTRIMWAEE